MRKIALVLLSFSFGSAVGAAQDLQPEEIIQRFAAKESEFREVWRKYTYNQQILFQTLNPSGEVSSEREVWVEVFFTNNGERKTRIVEDRGRLQGIRVTDEDMEDAIGRQPFVLTTEELSQYKIKYQGEEPVDQLHTYVFEVEPRKIQKGKRYFKGRIWVDDLDFQIVMTRGKIVPDYRTAEGQNKFPEFETLREQIDGEYWFPTWTEADDVLTFKSRRGATRHHIRQLITYQDYRKFDVDTTIKYGPVQGQDP